MLTELNPVDVAESVQQLVQGKETPPTEARRLEIERQEAQAVLPHAGQNEKQRAGET